MSPAPSPALIIDFSHGLRLEAREELVGLLAEHQLVAIQEDDIADPRTWIAHFADAGARDAAAAALHDRCPPGVHVRSADVEDEDWARRTQADLPAVRVGRIVVAPPWDVPAAGEAAADDVVVVIEPSRGFGTGHHQSTRLCLALLQTRALDGRTVLDVGTGSGVLAIVAARLGAAFVSAIDSDPDAIENARENIAHNGVNGTVEAHVRDIEAGVPPAADVVLANLTGTLLARHAAALDACVRAGGCLIASGFNVDERRIVEDAFAPGLHVSERAEEDGWWAYVLAR